MHASAVVTAPLITNPISANSANGSSRYAVEHLSDDALLAGARSLVARSNQQLASLLAHLAEVEARGIHRTHACASLCAYCVYVLRMSEDTAFRYARAAKLARRFPVLFEQIAAGEIHLTGLILLGTHLSDENHREVLRLAKHRSKREIIQLVRRLDPLPDVPSHIEPLGPAGARHLVTNGTWGAFMQALNPVRELAPDHRPSSWLRCVQDAELAHPASREDAPPEAPTPTGAPQDRPARRVGSTETARPAPAAELGFEQAGALTRDPAGAGEVELRSNGEHEHEHEHTAPPLNAQRYCIQFTATQEYVDLVERARDLLSHAVPSRSLAEVHLRAMRALVVELEKRKFGARQSARTAAAASVEVAHEPRARSRSQRSDPERSWFGREVAETSRFEARATNRPILPGPLASRSDCGTRECDRNDRGADDRGADDRGADDGSAEPPSRASSRRSKARDADAPRRRGERAISARVDADSPRPRSECGISARADADAPRPRGECAISAAADADAPRPRSECGISAAADADADAPRPRGQCAISTAADSDAPRRRGERAMSARADADAPRPRGQCGISARADTGSLPGRGERSSRGEKPGGRYIPAHVRREVKNRDSARCAYVAADGNRCRETSFLELHHHDPYAQGGTASVENLSLYCRAHNALAAEQDFGRAYMIRRSGRE